MNWMIYGIELLILMVCFALTVTIPMTVNPVSFVSDYPPEIQEEYYRSQRLEKKKAAARHGAYGWGIPPKVVPFEGRSGGCPAGSCLCHSNGRSHGMDFLGKELNGG